MMSTIFYAIPALAFLLVSALTIFGLNYYSRKLSHRSKAIEKRLQEATELRKSGAQESLAKSQNGSGSDLISQVIRKMPGYSNLALLIVRSGASITAVQCVMLSAAIGVAIAGFLLLATSLNAVIILLFGAVGASMPAAYFMQHEKKRLTKFETQLPEALDFLSRALRAGHGLTAALSMVAEELEEPIGNEFKVTFDEINFGLSFGEALSNLSMRVNSPDLSFFVIALLIQRETGGNLAELLENLAKTIRDRIKLVGKVRVISAEGRLSAIVITSMPFVLAGLMTMINPGYMSALWLTAAGNKLVAIGILMMMFGVFWISKIVKIKV